MTAVPVDEPRGWANPVTAERYADFVRRHAMYNETSRDLVALAAVSGNEVVVDLACGTGATTAAILAALDGGGTLIAVDGSPAMLAEARRAIDDPRVRWVESQAETVGEAVAPVANADAVICNSAIWQTDMAATLHGVAALLGPGGRLAFNIGRQFLMMPFSADELDPKGPSVFDLMSAFATIDHGHVATGPRGAPPLTVEHVTALVEAAGLLLAEVRECTYDDTVARQRDWLAIPVFSERFFPRLSDAQRMDALDKAFAAVDPAVATRARWMSFLAIKP